MKISICVGSACHLKGASDVIAKFKELIEKNALDVEFKASFCLGKCENKGVNIKIDNDKYSVSLDEVEKFFNDTILNK